MIKQIRREPTRGHLKLLLHVGGLFSQVEHRIRMQKALKPSPNLFRISYVPGLIAQKRKLKQWYRELSK